jgi:hypothetical protein
MPQSHSHTDRASARSLATRELTHEAAAALECIPAGSLTSETVSGILADLSLRLGWARELELISEGYLGPGAIKHNYRLLAEVSVDVMTLSNGMISPGDGSVIRDLRHRPDGSIIVLDTCGRLQLLIPLASGEWRVELPFEPYRIARFEVLPNGGVAAVLANGALLVARRGDGSGWNARVHQPGSGMGWLPVTSIKPHGTGFLITTQDTVGEWARRGEEFEFRHLFAYPHVRCLRALPERCFVAASLCGHVLLWRPNARGAFESMSLFAHESNVAAVGPLPGGRFYSLDVNGFLMEFSAPKPRRLPAPERGAPTRIGAAMRVQHRTDGELVVSTAKEMHVLSRKRGFWESIDSVSTAELLRSNGVAGLATCSEVSSNGRIIVGVCKPGGRNTVCILDGTTRGKEE